MAGFSKVGGMGMHSCPCLCAIHAMQGQEHIPLPPGEIAFNANAGILCTNARPPGSSTLTIEEETECD